jgi:beta-xylosidase
MKFISLLAGLVGVLTQVGIGRAQNSTYYNPILPGWHSDPSCAQVNGTFYCVTSTFIAFPGLPVYASKDLVNWKLISHAWNRESQLPGVSWGTTGQQQGMYAATIRYREGTFFVICEYLGTPTGNQGVVFKSSDPFADKAWSDPVIFRPNFIDPDLFWDDDGKSYSATQSIILQELNLDTGALSPAVSLWNGTGGVWPEGPHLYKKDGFYYLLIAEGGTATDHSVTMARSKNLKGPYVAYERNPVLTARGTNEFFQTVGHADLFQDTNGNWWGVALATRSGPEYQIYPMGRETVLFPVTWKEGEYPVASTVRGKMSGWPLPKPTRDIPGDGPFNGDPDVYDFNSTAAAIPKHFVYWRVPRVGTFTPTAQGLQVVPSRNNLTGQMTPKELTGQAGLSFVGRRQTDTQFKFSVDVSLAPGTQNTEAGVTVFLTQYNHLDLGLVRTNGALSLRFRAEAQDVSVPVPASVTVALPASWAAATGAIRLEIHAANRTHYTFSAGRVSSNGDVAECSKKTVAAASAQLVSAGTGTFVGSLVGVYATCNGDGSGTSCPQGENAYFQRWRYTGEAQAISATEVVPSTSYGQA